MYSPALFSAVLLFTASGFSSALPADSSADDLATAASKADTPGSAHDAAGCKKYHVSQGETCDLIAQKSQSHQPPFTQADKAFTTQEFLAWNPSINAQCTNMLADNDYCVTKPGSTGGKKGGKKSGSKPKHTKSDPAKPPNGHGGDQKQGASTNACDKWYTAVDGDTCYKIAHDKKVSWDDFLNWNPYLVTLDRNNNKVCGKIEAGKPYCVGRPTAYRAIGFYHANCQGKVHNDVSVPPGTQNADGVCINTDCQVGSLLIPPKIHGVIECPGQQVQISYFESRDCGEGNWFGYGYASQGDCHELWQDGWPVQSLHLRCAPEKDDCATRGECRVDGAPANPICKRLGILSAGQ